MVSASAPEILVFMSIAPELSFFITWFQLQLRLLFVFIRYIFDCLGVSQVDWEMKYIWHIEYITLILVG